MNSLQRIDNLNLHVKPVFVTQPSLKRSVSFKENILCTPSCLCHGKGLCFMKNLVYQLSCNLCSQLYIGETSRTFRQRIYEHLSSESSFFYKHFIDVHGMLPDLSFVSSFILKRGFANTTERKISEKEFIKMRRPNINVRLF